MLLGSSLVGAELTVGRLGAVLRSDMPARGDAAGAVLSFPLRLPSATRQCHTVSKPRIQDLTP